MQVQKRDGRIVDFDQKRIYNAIVKAMVETVNGADYMLASIISQSIENKFNNKINTTTDEIHDAVENALMDSPRKDAAKSYILYRDARKRQQDDEPKYKLLSKEFLSKYKHLENPMSELGSFVYYRTYSRYLPDKKRREYWWETVARAVDYNCSLQDSTTREEAEELFDNMFNLRQFLAGRTLWSGGTTTAYSNPISQYNCSGIALDNFDSYKDICYLLMLGVGVGFTAEKKHVEKLPKVRGNIKVIHQEYEPFTNKKMRKESTEFNITGDVIEIVVGDSKLGWANAIDLLIKVFYSIDFNHINFIMINYNSVRPHGEPLKTFGGTASGHEALKTILEKTTKVLLKDNKGYKKLRPIEAMDIANIIAEGIVVGGVRRCIPEGTLINTKTGLIPIEKITVGEEVLTSNGYSKITNLFHQGKQNLWTINTKTGDYKYTKNHRVAVMISPEKYIWKTVEEIVPGDRLVFVADFIPGSKTELPKIKENSKIIVPELNEEVAWLIGYLHGNGCVQQKEVSFSIPLSSPQIKNKIIDILERFGVKPKESLGNGKYFVIRCSSVDLAEYFSQFKIPKTEIKIPDFILKGLIPIREHYLTGLYDADGAIDERPIQIVSSIYPKFLIEIRALYSSIGIPVRLKKIRDARENWKTLYDIRVIGEKAKEDFVEKIGKKSLKFGNNSKTRRSQNDFGYPSDWVKKYDGIGWTKQSKQMTVSRYEKITSTKQKLIPIEVLQITNNEEIFETYDIEVETHEFSCEGILVHNSAEMAFIDVDDDEMMNAKRDLYVQDSTGKWVANQDILHRMMSNNSVAYYKRPTLEELKKRFEIIRHSAEGNFYNMEAAAKRKSNIKVSNP